MKWFNGLYFKRVNTRKDEKGVFVEEYIELFASSRLFSDSYYSRLLAH